jgi:hypothetical protein
MIRYEEKRSAWIVQRHPDETFYETKVIYIRDAWIESRSVGMRLHSVFRSLRVLSPDSRHHMPPRPQKRWPHPRSATIPMDQYDSNYRALIINSTCAKHPAAGVREKPKGLQMVECARLGKFEPTGT